MAIGLVFLKYGIFVIDGSPAAVNTVGKAMVQDAQKLTQPMTELIEGGGDAKSGAIVESGVWPEA